MVIYSLVYDSSVFRTTAKLMTGRQSKLFPGTGPDIKPKGGEAFNNRQLLSNNEVYCVLQRIRASISRRRLRRCRWATCHGFVHN